MSFGQNFGVLVRRYREAQGLSSGELADLAFDDTAKKSRVSEIENGRVKAPQSKTIDALRIALAIPQEEIDALRTPPAVDHALIDRIKAEMNLATNGLLEGLALRFDIENPDAPRAVLAEFLKDKAREWQDLKARLAALTEMDGRLANQVAGAEDAIARDDFDEAEQILAAAEEIQQQEKTLAEVRKQSQIRSARAEAALLKGDQDQAFRHFKASAGMFDAFDPLEGAQVRRGHYVALYQHGRQFPGPALAHAATLARDNLEAYADPAQIEDRGKTLNNLAIFLQEQGIRADGTKGAELLDRAVQAYRKALQIRTRDAMPAAWAATQNNLGYALQEQGSRTEGPAGAVLLDQAVQAYREALQTRTRDAMPAQWAMTQNNLGNALKEQGIRTDGAPGAALLDQAVQAYSKALEVHTRDAMPADWAMTQNNLGLVFEAKADRLDGSDREARLTEALAHFDAALEVYDPDAMGFYFEKCTKARDRVAAKLAGTWVAPEDEPGDG